MAEIQELKLTITEEQYWALYLFINHKFNHSNDEIIVYSGWSTGKQPQKLFIMMGI